VYQATLQALTARVEREPAFERIAGAVFRQRYYREVLDEDLTGDELDREYRATFVANLERAADAGLLDERMTERFDLADLAAALEPERDERLEYMAMETLYQRYFLKTEQRGRTSNCPRRSGCASRWGSHWRKTTRSDAPKSSTACSRNWSSRRRPRRCSTAASPVHSCPRVT